MEASMFTSNFNDMEMNDLIFMDHLQIEDICGPSYLPTISSEDIHQQQASLLYAQEANHHHHHHHHHTTNAIIEEKPFKHLVETSNWNNNDNNSYNNINNNNHALISQDASNNSIMLSFDNTNNSSNTSQSITVDDHHPQVAKKTSNNLVNNVSQHSKDHILAERKRREKLNQRFIALSTVIPGLKKMDKATVLGDAYKYVKQLEKQVKTLEEVTKAKKIESAVLVNRSTVSEHDDHCSSMEDVSYGGSIDGQFPEIEVKFSNKDVLIRIHCEKKNNRVIEKLISQIENLNLVVNNSSVLIFGCASLDATIIAQMGNEFNMTAKDLVRHLHDALSRLMSGTNE